MKKNFYKIMSLSLASLLGIGGLVGLSKIPANNVSEVKATGTTVDLSTLTENYEAQDGDILTGTIASKYIEVSIADNASVTLKDVNIPMNSFTWSDNPKTPHPGISLNGDATLILEGENSIGGDDDERPSISVPKDYTLTIEGDGVLNADNRDSAWASAIGGRFKNDCGDIVINGGTINAAGGRNGGAALGGPVDGSSGDIIINGGTLNLSSTDGACIGSGYGYFKENDEVIGGDVTINGGTIFASSNYGVGIGAGESSTCGDITIYDTVTSIRIEVTNSTYTIGPCEDAICGTITIAGDVVDPVTRNPFIYPAPPHEHDWSYVASGASITATCGNEDCPVTTGLTLTLEAPTSLTYDEYPKVASLAAGYSSEAFGTPSISYFKNNVSVAQCVDAGDYEARVTVGGATASLEFTISQAAPTGYVVPTGLEATYGDALSSVVLPTNWAWKTPTDLVGNVGNREHVAIYTPVDPNYHSVEETLTVAVAQATPTDYEKPTGLTAEYGSTLSSIILPNEWSWKTPADLVGNLGNNNHVAIYTPTDPNYKTVEDILVVNVTQAAPTGYDIPTGLEATYGDVLSSVVLPTNWAWKTPTDLVGNAGNREHVAIYTPVDPNYHSVEENVSITVKKANPTYIVPTGIEAPYDVTLSTIGLPQGFSWMDGNQKTLAWGENTFKAKYTPSDTANYNVVEDIDIKVNVKWILVDPTAGDVTVTVNGGETEFNVNISVKIEIKTEVSVDEKKNEYSSLANGYVNPNEDIAAIYDVKLIRTIDGVEHEIQPSDIKAGTKVTISMALPNELVGKDFRLLHIHNNNDIEEITTDKFAITRDSKTLMLETDRLSEFAFVVAAQGNNGFDYPSRGLPGWAVALIVVGAILLLICGAYFLLFFVFNKWIKREDKANRVFPFTFGKKEDKLRVLAFPFKFEYRVKSEIYKTKDEALK